MRSPPPGVSAIGGSAKAEQRRGAAPFIRRRSTVWASELLKHLLTGLWSIRIYVEHRLVYTLIDGEIVILQRRYHC